MVEPGWHPMNAVELQPGNAELQLGPVPNRILQERTETKESD